MHPSADTQRVIAGRYRLQAPIGRGAMGVVWRARDQLLDRDVAVKEVQMAETLTDAERANAYQRTLREAKTAARLNHPGVVTVYDVAEDSGRPWIVMQLVSAQSLDQVLATSGPLSPRRAAEMGRQLLSALSVAHAAGVMHRDVKPSNVLLGRDDRAVLTDFGIATFAGDPKLTQTGMVMGSPGFTAPERIRGEDASPASDLWSLGATLYAAAEGHGPYEKRGGAITTMSAIINEDAPAAQTAGPLAPVIAALLRREPADRPDAATAARMITDVLPLLPTRTERGPAGYEVTSLSAAHQPAPPQPPPPRPAPPRLRPLQPRSAQPGQTSPDSGSADQTPWGEPPGWPADTQAGGEPSSSQTAPTTPHPVLGAAAGYAEAEQSARYDRPQGGWSQGGSSAGSAPGPSPGSSPAYPPGPDSPSLPAVPPPDFSSWYDPSPRSGPAASAQPWSGAGSRAGPASPAGAGSPARSGAAAPAGARPDHRPGVQRWRRPGLWWKIALVSLAVLGAAAGAITILLLRHDTGSTGGSSSAATLASPSTAPQIVNAINEPATRALPVGWTTFTHQASNGGNAGFKIAYPAKWTPSASGDQTTLTDPSANVNIQIDLTPHTFLHDMLREAQFIKTRSLTDGRFPGYTQLGLAAIRIRHTAGSYWKFTWVDNNVQQEAIDLLFVLPTSSGPQSYALYMTAPASQWSQARPIFDEEAETFASLT
jgi:serine/threonine protein kinase